MDYEVDIGVCNIRIGMKNSNALPFQFYGFALLKNCMSDSWTEIMLELEIEKALFDSFINCIDV